MSMMSHNETVDGLGGTGCCWLVVGCSGSKVTTKASAELPRYQIRTIALVPFTTLATPQVRDVSRSDLLSAAGGSQV